MDKAAAQGEGESPPLILLLQILADQGLVAWGKKVWHASARGAGRGRALGARALGPGGHFEPCHVFPQDDQIERERATRHVSGGCCALVAVYLLGKFYVANAGDSRYGARGRASSFPAWWKGILVRPSPCRKAVLRLQDDLTAGM